MKNKLLSLIFAFTLFAAMFATSVSAMSAFEQNFDVDIAPDNVTQTVDVVEPVQNANQAAQTYTLCAGWNFITNTGIGCVTVTIS